MRLAVLTSVETRHRYLVRRLLHEFQLVGVAYEETGYSPAKIDDSDLTPEEVRIVAGHFAQRSIQETAFFGSDSEFVEPDGSCCVRHLGPGTLNSNDTLTLLTGAATDTVVVFGTNLVRPPLLGRWPGRMINMHLGLSPYYRGTATNFYPLLNEEPEYVGATIHLLDPGIDSGPILRHARPPIAADDTPHTIGCKAILAGIEALIEVLRDLQQGICRPVPQWPVGRPRLYRRKDYHPRQVVELYSKIEGGLLPRYIERAPEVADRVRLVE